MGTVIVPLSSRKYPGLHAVVDEADYELVAPYSWSPRSKDARYAQAYIGGGRKGRRVVLMHRLIMGFPEGVIDHIDGDGLNNSRSNLRLVTVGENTVNTLILPTSSSGYRGVSRTNTGRWRARLHDYLIGTFSDPVAAAVAYDRHVRSVYGEVAATNEGLGLLTREEARMNPEPFRTGRRR